MRDRIEGYLTPFLFHHILSRVERLAGIRHAPGP